MMERQVSIFKAVVGILERSVQHERASKQGTASRIQYVGVGLARRPSGMSFFVYLFMQMRGNRKFRQSVQVLSVLY